MKKQSTAIIAAITSLLLLSGCAGTSKGAYSGNIADDTEVSEGTAGSGLAPAAAVNPGFSDAGGIDDERKNPNSLVNRRIVYFDYDKSEVREEALPILQAHAELLSRNPVLGVILSGNTDDRGSNEYNLALGQRRANAVRDILASFGVPTSQMESLSFGETQPVATGQNEHDWQLNRRVEIRYTDE